jgi:lipopolysaccharide/colanic/teichoic acid biosynthesis glycosyltransferase
MTVEEVRRPAPSLAVPDARARTLEPPVVHRLAPETVQRIETAVVDALRRPPRVMAVGSASAVPESLASLVTPGVSEPREATVLLICPPGGGEELLGPNLSAFERACAEVVEQAVPGQTVIMTSARYVGAARDLLTIPLASRGLAPGRDVYVAVSPQPIPGAPPRVARVVAGATPFCAAMAAGVLRDAGHVTILPSLEEAEAASLTSHAPSGIGAIAKRILDVVGAAVGLVLLSPLMAIIAAAVKLDSPGPVLFTQDRVGRGGRLFRFRKFRTMTDGAEQRLGEVLHLNNIKGPGFQIDSDPRVTRVGRFLRKSSLDELPELWAVLRGDMSLVGPRPAPIFEVAAYEPWHLRRLAMKPGITGLAQVRARKYREFRVKVGLDFQYIDHWSPWLDVRLLLETIPAVLRYTGR